MGSPHLAESNTERAETVALIDFYRETDHITVTEACKRANCPDGSYYNWKNRGDLRPLVKDAKLALAGKLLNKEPIPPSPLALKDIVKTAVAEHFPEATGSSPYPKNRWANGGKGENGKHQPIIETNPTVDEPAGEVEVVERQTALPTITHSSYRGGVEQAPADVVTTALSAEKADKTLVQAVKDLKAKLQAALQERDALQAMLGDILVRSRLKGFLAKQAGG